MYGISITQTVLLMLGIYILPVNCEDYARHINTLCDQISEF